MSDISGRLSQVRAEIEKATHLAGRAPMSVQLLAVSKTKTVDDIKQAIAAKQMDFAENYVQEALGKITALASYKDIRWHYIGHIQRNKTLKIAKYFDFVHTVSDPIIVKRLSEHRAPSATPLSICIQVNLEEDLNRDGVVAAEVAQIARYCAQFPNIRLRGLMTLPHFSSNEEQRRMHFAQLRQMLVDLNQQYQLHLDTLSMGMSDDYVVAIQEGATMVRIGRAIFGER